MTRPERNNQMNQKRSKKFFALEVNHQTNSTLFCKEKWLFKAEMKASLCLSALSVILVLTVLLMTTTLRISQPESQNMQEYLELRESTTEKQLVTSTTLSDDFYI